MIENNNEQIPFNKPYLTGNELVYIKDSINSGKISGDSIFTKKCHEYFENKFNAKCLLTTSCTDALEMCAILLNIKPGDEVIMPSFTFVSTANAFILRGAKIIFIDSTNLNPNMNVLDIENLITNKTKAIVCVHYAGIACDMKYILNIAKKYNIFVVEDAAQAFDSYYENKHLGTFGHLATFSFHETKNIQSGEGGLLVINDLSLYNRAEIIREKGTNRSSFFKGEIDKYGWVDIGSSFLPSDIIAAFLYSQIQNSDIIQERRKAIWNKYNLHLQNLEKLGLINLPKLPIYATNNAHMFYILLPNIEIRTDLINFLKASNIQSVFHYVSLHSSKYYIKNHDNRVLAWSDFYTNNLLRLPLYFELDNDKQMFIISKIFEFFKIKNDE